MLKEISTHKMLEAEMALHEQLYLLLYKKGSDQSDCAKTALEKAKAEIQNVQVFAADVTTARDIHPVYGLKTVPVLIEFKNKQLKNVTKGCQSSNYLELLFKKSFNKDKTEEKGTIQKRVTVYSTPTCSWCNTLKRYLDEHRISYTDIDVSKDQKKAEEMVKRSGQQGVPQTDINGTMIIGFDKNRIDQLLNLRNY